MFSNIVLMMISGMFFNGTYALITTTISADLGTHGSLKGNSRALATVTAIIDGTGSVGAALGPLLIDFISTDGWNGVFNIFNFWPSFEPHGCGRDCGQDCQGKRKV
jgi:MFS family permease